MPYPTAIAVALTVIFSCTAIGYVTLAVLRHGQAATGIADLLHVIMSLAMLAMPWSWGTTYAPPTLQTIVFSLATLYFVVILIGGARLDGHSHHGSGGERHLLVAYHVVMMAAMVVMALMMRDMSHRSSTSDHSMHGMSMGSSGSQMSMGIGTGWTVTSWICVGIFAVSGLGLILRWIRTRRSLDSLLEPALLLMMSAGMALAFIPTW